MSWTNVLIVIHQLSLIQLSQMPIAKKAMEPFLPHDVIYRPKSGFGAPLRRWLRGELKNLKQDLLSVETLTRRGLFDPLAVATLVAQDERGEKDASYTILSLMCILGI